MKLLFQRIERGLDRFTAIGERILFGQDRIDLLTQFVALVYLLVVVLFDAVMIGYRVVIGSFDLLELRSERFKILSSALCLDLLVFERTDAHGKFLFVGLATFAQHDALRVDGLSDRTHAAIIVSECRFVLA
ncbi:unknown [Eggerthella sp. CAG:298]|nr:unknown [Eggerthella sp. CAG:298]